MNAFLTWIIPFLTFWILGRALWTQASRPPPLKSDPPDGTKDRNKL
jgi:hypothetical protein